MFTLDTNCLIYYFKGEEKVIDLIQNLILERTPIFISIITKVEVLAYPEMLLLLPPRFIQILLLSQETLKIFRKLRN
jgi:predicted nucleic acid-binding protein